MGAEITAITTGETIRPARIEEVDVSTLPTVDEGDELVPGAVLGKGGMGVVHSATQTALRRDVALKRPIKGNRESIAALVREARILGSLEHPNIPPVHLLAADATGTPVLAMKRIDGRAWGAQLAANEPAPLEHTLEILEAVCHALHFAHERGIIHRDVKPGNIMLGAHGEIYLVDWGIALVGAEALAPNKLAGTPSYMAPEMAWRRPITPRTDVYLVGASLYRALTSSPPHAAEDTVVAIEHARSGTITPLPDGVPVEIAKVCMRALAADPGDRFASAEDLRLALARCRKHLATAGLVSASQARAKALGLMAEDTSLSPERRVEARALFREASFGFNQALQVTGDDAVARASRDGAAVAMARIELGGGDDRAATALLVDVASVPEDLTAAITARSAVRANDERELARLRGLAREHDARIGSSARTAAIAGLIAFWAIFSLLVNPIGRRYPRFNRDFVLSVPVPIAFCGTVILIGAVLRGVVPSTKINRQFFGAFVISSFWMLLSRCYVVYGLGADVGRAIPNDLAGLALLSCGLAVTSDARLLVASAAFLAAAVVSALWPGAAFPFALSLLVFAGTAVRIWRRPSA